MTADQRSDRTNAALLAARIAHHNRTQATDAYRAAIRTAIRAGATYAELAATLGTTRQAIRQYTLTN